MNATAWSGGVDDDGSELRMGELYRITYEFPSERVVTVMMAVIAFIIVFDSSLKSLERWLSGSVYRLALDNNAVATTAAGGGTAGFKEVNLYRGLDVAQMALLVRGDVSPEGDGWKTQYQIPVVVQSGSPEPVFAKGAPAGLALEFTAIEDPNAASAAARFGKLVVQHQAPV